MVHGDRYDYSETKYVNYSENVSIICPEHGRFAQAPGNHLSGKGCPECGINKRARGRTKSTEQFIHEASSIHGDKYDYSHVIYTGEYQGVNILCPIHGEFTQDPKVHLMGSGCPKCGLLKIGEKKRLSQDDFLERSYKIHGDKYDYTKVDYQGQNTNVKIICPIHGVFTQLPSTHLNGGGCPACSGVERYGQSGFIERAKEIHGEKYDYSKVDYVNAKSKVEIICPEHGSFMSEPYHHTKGTGCPRCGADRISEALLLTKEEWIERAGNIHGDKYDYSRVDYAGGRNPVEIVCPEHGPFLQPPRIHIHQESGCPLCAESGVKLDAPGILYYIRINTHTHTLWKIGITNRTVHKRFVGDLSKITVIRAWPFDVLRDAFEIEKEILKTCIEHAYTGPDKPLSKGGNTELFTLDVLCLDKDYT